ncbi:hypothetical protein GCM10027275_20080 [Rhabdobacter roseus]|uniref:Glycosyltransferase RgtA/B/C/D-like domain-containing protein n=1 Tax=Rhabdobacter roseus TaxID=1655419 RepID=A0A840TWB8_9BACT|nr:hypothetical protein [Rhabdobacter roseus]MBB5283939.1 hypothetical protein [Rhabdobacter roseus]
MPAANPTRSVFFFGVIVLGIVLLYVGYINHYALNIPISDDYDLVRVKYTLLTQELSGWEQLKLLLEPENDHRILFPRLVALGFYAWEGFINYRTLIFFVNACLLGLLLVWGLSFRRQGLSHWYLLPVLLWYLNPFLYDVTLWGINGMQHTMLNLLVFSSLYVLSYFQKKGTLLVGLVLALMATFTNGNGFLVFPAGLAMLLVAREWGKSAVWSAGMLVALGGYFFNYKAGQATQVDFTAEFIRNVAISFGALSAGWVEAFGADPGTLIWLSFGLGYLTLLLIVLGLALLLFPVTTFSARSGPYFWVGVLVFSALTIGIIAVSRGGRDLFSVFTSRYSLYPIHLLTLVYVIVLAVVRRGPQRVIFVGALLFGLLFVAESYFQYAKGRDVRYRNLVADHFNWRQHRRLVTHFRSDLADFFTLDAYQRGIYRMSDFPLVGAERAMRARWSSTIHEVPLALTTQTDSIRFFGTPQQITQFTLDNTTLPDQNRGYYLVLKSHSGATYLLPTWPTPGGRKRFFTAGEVYKPGFTVTSYTENFRPGTYRIGLLTGQPGKYQVQSTSYALQVDSTSASLRIQPLSP